MKPQRGFSLISAIFLIVVLAGLAAYLVNTGGVQRTTFIQSVLGARAWQAARSGIEWGAHRALNASGACNGGYTLDGFTVTVSCTSSSHTEQAQTVTVYAITALAEQGTYGAGSEYISRRIEASVSVTPP